MQALDIRLDQLAHRRRTLSEHAEVDKLDRQLSDVGDLIVAAETEHSDLERQRDKAEGDVEQVRVRARRDQQRLDAGSVSSPRELQNLQSEIASLARRQSDLEDVELEFLERLEDTERRLNELGTRRDELSAEREALAARRDALLAEIDGEAGQARVARAVLAADVDAPLLALYAKIREQQGGIGAAALRQRCCLGCRLELDITEVNSLRTAAADEVLRHEECRRILVRTPESGL